MIEIWIIKNDGVNKYDISSIVSKISWDSKMSLTSIIDFDVIESQNPLMPAKIVEEGDLIIIYADKEEVTRGIVVKSKNSGSGKVSYTAFDYAWYLGKSKSVYQFNGTNAKAAIETILYDFGLPIGAISQMVVNVDSIYVQKTPAEIIKDIIDQEEHQTGKRFFSEIKSGRIYIEEMSEMISIGFFKLSGNTAQIDILSNSLGAEKTRSIENTRNRIKLILSSNDSYETVALEQDAQMISKYGLLEETYKIEESDLAKARQAAKVLLGRLSKVHETNTISLLGDPVFKAGRLFDVEEPSTGISGRFMITECKHSISGGLHTMDLVLTLPEDVS